MGKYKEEKVIDNNNNNILIDENDDNSNEQIQNYQNQNYDAIFNEARNLFDDNDNKQQQQNNENNGNDDGMDQDDQSNKRNIGEVYNKRIPQPPIKRRKINNNAWLLLKKHLTNVSTNNKPTLSTTSSTITIEDKSINDDIINPIGNQFNDKL